MIRPTELYHAAANVETLVGLIQHNPNYRTPGEALEPIAKMLRDAADALTDAAMLSTRRVA